MNRCQVCDKTDEDDPKACISIFEGETRCANCHEEIFKNLEDLSVNDTIEIDYLDTFLLPEPVVEDNWLETPLSEVPEQ